MHLLQNPPTHPCFYIFKNSIFLKGGAAREKSPKIAKGGTRELVLGPGSLCKFPWIHIKNVTNVYYVYLCSFLDFASSKDASRLIVGVTAVKICTGHVHISLIVIALAWRRRRLATYVLTHVIKNTASLRDSGSVLTVSVTFEDLHLMQFYNKYGFSISHFDIASGLFTLTFLTWPQTLRSLYTM